MAAVYRRKYWTTTKDGVREQRQQEHYTIEYRDPANRIVRVRGPKDRKAAKAIAADIARKLERGEAGILDVYKEHRNRPLSDHLAEYLSDLRTLGRDDMYVYNVGKRLRKLMVECGWDRLGSITPDSFCGWRDRQGKEKSARTLNQFLETVNGFLNWCAGKRNRLPANPLARVEKVIGDEVRKRRALTDEEVEYLLATAAADRKFAYVVMLETGLRVQEAADLEWQDVHIASTTPHLLLRASKVKSRRDQSLPLRADLAERFRQARPEECSPTDRVFDRVPSLYWWKKDLDAARERWIAEGATSKEQERRRESDFLRFIDRAGRQADRHSMRKTLGTRLQRAGVAIRVAMELMRHSDIRLTTKVYTDPSVFDLTHAVNSLPALLPSAPAVTSKTAG